MTKRINGAMALSLAGAGLLLAGCSSVPMLPGNDGAPTAASLAIGSAAPARVSVADAPPEVYVRLARQIYACWLSSEPPLLPGQLFYAEAEPGDGGSARISLHTPGADGQKGVRTYLINMQRQGDGTGIETEALRIEDAAQREAMHRSVMAWAQGETSCSTAPAAEPTVTAAIPATAPAAATGKAGTAAVKADKSRTLATAKADGAAPAKPKTDSKAAAAAKTAAVNAPATAKPAATAKRTGEPTAGTAAVPTPSAAAPLPAGSTGTAEAKAKPAETASLRGALASEPTPPVSPAPPALPAATEAPHPDASAASVRVHTPSALPVAPQPMGMLMPQPLAAASSDEPAPPTAKADKLPGEHMFLQSEPGFVGR